MSKTQPTPDLGGRPRLPKGDGKTSTLHIRLEPRRKAKYVKAAQKSAERKLATWVLKHLDAAAAKK